MPARVLLLSAALLFLVDQCVKVWALARLGDDVWPTTITLDRQAS